MGWGRNGEGAELTPRSNGTLGLYKALGVLGYNPYHLVTAFTAGATHVRLIREGMAARMDGEGKQYGREDFDKWFADNGVQPTSAPPFPSCPPYPY